MNVQPFEVEFLKKASQIPVNLWDALFQPPAAGRWWYEALEQLGSRGRCSFIARFYYHCERSILL